jgi:hypothetical protein
MEGSVYSFLKTEGKVSDTGSAHLNSIFHSSKGKKIAIEKKIVN